MLHAVGMDNAYAFLKNSTLTLVIMTRKELSEANAIGGKSPLSSFQRPPWRAQHGEYHAHVVLWLTLLELCVTDSQALVP